MNDEISCTEVKSRLQRGEDFHFWDVREEWEYEEKNLGAKCMPLNDLPFRIQALLQFQSQEIIVHCKTGDRSKKARKFLQSKGFTHVLSMKGGMEAYFKD